MPLLNRSDFDDLPSEPSERWLALRDLLEIRLSSTENSQDGLQEAIILEYAHIITASFEELGFGEIEVFSAGNAHDEFPQFRAKIAALAARLSLVNTKTKNSTGLRISSTIEGRLRSEVHRLKSVVSESNLPDAKKRRLQNLLDELEQELDDRKIEYSKWLRSLGFCAVVLSETVQVSAATATIVHLLGLQEAAEEQRQDSLQLPAEPDTRLLPSPPRSLPAPKVEQSGDDESTQGSIQI